MKRGIWMAAALGIAATGLAGCSEQPQPAETAPEGPQGISVADARLMLPAVKGNPGAVYFEVKNAGEENRVLRAVSVAGAGSTMMHTKEMLEVAQVAVPAGGGSAKFEPGARHVMVMDLADTVTAGSQAEVTLTFVGGNKITFPAEVRAAGDER